MQTLEAELVQRYNFINTKKKPELTKGLWDSEAGKSQNQRRQSTQAKKSDTEQARVKD